MPSEAEKYWQYSRECTKQAVESETPELQQRLLELARLWTEAAFCDERNADRHRGVIALNKSRAAHHGRDYYVHSTRVLL